MCIQKGKKAVVPVCVRKIVSVEIDCLHFQVGKFPSQPNHESNREGRVFIFFIYFFICFVPGVHKEDPLRCIVVERERS